MELAKLLVEAISGNSVLIDQTAKRWPDRPIQLELSWHPGMRKLDMRLITTDHLPSYRLPNPSAEAVVTLTVAPEDAAPLSE